MRDYARETQDRVAYIRGIVADAKAKGIVYANSGGKDCTLVSILCKAACVDTLGLMLPCASRRNYGEDIDDAIAVARQFGIEQLRIDLTVTRETLHAAIGTSCNLSPMALANINPRLRMITLYAIAQSRGYLVAGTGNRSEIHTGYFTKWGDGAYDFNPIGDLTASEVFEFLRHLNAPAHVIDKVPSAGLYEGQTDEAEMGLTYAAIDGYLLHGNAAPDDIARIDRLHGVSAHKRRPPPIYPNR